MILNSPLFYHNRFLYVCPLSVSFTLLLLECADGFVNSWMEYCHWNIKSSIQQMFVLTWFDVAIFVVELYFFYEQKKFSSISKMFMWLNVKRLMCAYASILNINREFVCTSKTWCRTEQNRKKKLRTLWSNWQWRQWQRRFGRFWLRSFHLTLFMMFSFENHQRRRTSFFNLSLYTHFDSGTSF